MNTGVSKNLGQDFAYIIDSPGNDTFVGGTAYSYMYIRNAHGSYAEFDAAKPLKLRGTVKQLMLLAEAAQAAGVAGGGATMGRPTCAVLPEAMQSGKPATRFGCIGNRVYTGLGDDEGYYAIPGAKVAEVVSKLAVITEANRQLEVFHLARRVQNPSVS